MIFWLKKQYYRLHIKWLILFNPARLFDQINQLNWYKNTLCQWVDDQHLQTDHQVLEVACASGEVTAYIAKSAIPTGVDFSRNMIKLAQTKHKSIQFLEADVLDLPFENNYFDVVIAASLINIVDNKYKAISELSRTCKKGGLITKL